MVVALAGYTVAFAAVGPVACIVAAAVALAEYMFSAAVAAVPVDCTFSVAVAAVAAVVPADYTFSVAVAAVVVAAVQVEYTFSVVVAAVAQEAYMYVAAAAEVAEAFEAE